MSRFRGGWGARPENALKRAEELENVGQKAAALQSLRDVITSKRSRANWSKTYEDIMFKLMDLCVEMKRRNDAKEALMQYRNMCQQVNINSLEEVIKYYLNKATEKAEEARLQAEVGVWEGWCGSARLAATSARARLRAHRRGDG
jgi:translation initiation factor 3 subunit A